MHHGVRPSAGPAVRVVWSSFAQFGLVHRNLETVHRFPETAKSRWEAEPGPVVDIATTL